MHYAIMEVMHLWRLAVVLKHITFAGAQKSDAYIEVMQLWEVQLWRVDCTTMLYIFKKP